MKMDINNILNNVTKIEALKLYLEKLDFCDDYRSRIHNGDLDIDFSVTDILYKNEIRAIENFYIKGVDPASNEEYYRLNLNFFDVKFSQNMSTKEELVNLLFTELDPSKRLKKLVEMKRILKKK